MLHILTKFYDDDVIQTNIMAILSTGTSRIFGVSCRNLWKKCTDQLPQNLAQVHNLVPSSM